MSFANRSQKYRWRLVVGLVVLGILGLTAAWWLTSTSSPATPARLTVASTIFPLTDIVQQVAGDDVRVVELIPSGSSPHAASLTPQQLADAQQARALFMIGHGLDDWAADAITRNTDAAVIVVDEDITLRSFEEGEHDDHEDEDHAAEGDGLDPHYWLTVPNAQQIARTAAAQLAAIDPAHAADYHHNLELYLVELDELEIALQRAARGVEQKDFIAIHDGWSYFAGHYDFSLVATYEPQEGQQPSLADLQRLQELVTEHNIDVFYTEPQKQSSAAVRVFRDEFGLEIRVLDPVGGVGVRDSYAELMRENMRALGGSL